MTGRLVCIAVATVIALSSVAVWLVLSRDQSSGPPQAWDGPANVAELEIKGEPPDGALSWSTIAVAEPRTPASIERGRELFAKSCAGCHGLEGKGDGPVSKKYEFSSLPANLAKPIQSVKIRSTLIGAPPLPADLFRTITRGMPGTAMWSYAKLPPEDRWALVEFIQSLSPDYAKKTEAAQLPPKLSDSPELRETGEEFYNNFCLNCHGEKGLGGQPLLRDGETNRVFPGLRFAREGGKFTLSGSSTDDIARTLMAGFHDKSPMRSFRETIYTQQNPTPEQKAAMDRKFWGVVFYTRGLIEAQAKP